MKKSKILFEQTQEVIILPDLHIPFCNFKVIEAAYEFYISRVLSGAKIKIIQIGDLTDQKAWSRFQKDPDDYSPELEWAHTMTQVSLLKEYFPEMTIILGNHDRRIAMKATEASLPQSLSEPYTRFFKPQDGPFTLPTPHSSSKESRIFTEMSWQEHLLSKRNTLEHLLLWVTLTKRLSRLVPTF